MRKKIQIPVNDIPLIKRKLFVWASQFSPFSYLDSNQYHNGHLSTSLYADYECIAGIGSIDKLLAEKSDNFSRLKKFYNEKEDWLFGAMSYDLKNEIEALSSNNPDKVKFPKIHFFQPLIVLYIKGNTLHFEYSEKHISEQEMHKNISEIHETSIKHAEKYGTNIAHSRFSHEEYINTVHKIKKDIQRGNIYEMNFCQEFFIEDIDFDPYATYMRLINQSPSPFSCFYHLSNHFLLSASPERFIKKEGDKIISQPIKGTAKRSNKAKRDKELKKNLLTDPKERIENIMITDIVRNDLAKTSLPGTVEVEELCEVYSFQQAHQMISTIIAEKNNKYHVVDVIKEAFPMGSMTGAPKIKAMELIEKYEKSGRGIFSGAVGYFHPNGNFDFNVIIRSILYNQLKKYVSFSMGSAITHRSDPQKEYEECMIKAKPMMNALNIVVN